jgi:hypothetical protein
MSSINDSSTPEWQINNGILSPALTSRFIVYFSPKDESLAIDWDGNFLTRQVRDISYSLSSDMVTLHIEEPAAVEVAVSAIVMFPQVIQTITIVNAFDGKFPQIGTCLFGLTLDNHFVDRNYGKHDAVIHKFRFKFNNIQTTTINGIATEE